MLSGHNLPTSQWINTGSRKIGLRTIGPQTIFWGRPVGPWGQTVRSPIFQESLVIDQGILERGWGGAEGGGSCIEYEFSPYNAEVSFSKQADVDMVKQEDPQACAGIMSLLHSPPPNC